MLKDRAPAPIREKCIQSRLLVGVSGVEHGFGTRAEPLAPTLSDIVSKTQWKQVHGVAIAQLSGPQQSCGEVDGFWTQLPQTPSAIVTADCVPILLTRRDGNAVAALHAGWRGTLAQIVQNLFESQLLKAGEKPWQWVAAIGPCARECCYEVSPELAKAFKNKFGSQVIRKQRHLDLVRSNLVQLQTLGIEEVDTQTAHCTLCSRDDAGQFAFHSYRRDGSGGRQYSWIQRAKTT
jgi:YfiH family protein